MLHDKLESSFTHGHKMTRPQPKILVLRAAGINCEAETVYAWQLAGGQADIVHINRLKENKKKLGDYQIFNVPGGFSYGDDVGAGKILANQINVFLGDTNPLLNAACLKKTLNGASCQVKQDLPAIQR